METLKSAENRKGLVFYPELEVSCTGRIDSLSIFTMQKQIELKVPKPNRYCPQIIIPIFGIKLFIRAQFSKFGGKGRRGLTSHLCPKSAKIIQSGAWYVRNPVRMTAIRNSTIQSGQRFRTKLLALQRLVSNIAPAMAAT